MVNRKGTTWRKLSAEEQKAVKDADAAKALMMTLPSLIKRPLVTRSNKVILLGFDEAQWQQVLGRVNTP